MKMLFVTAVPIGKVLKRLKRSQCKLVVTDDVYDVCVCVVL